MTKPIPVDGKLISGYVASFAKDGNLNAAKLSHGPRYTSGSDVIMDFGADARAVARKDPLSPTPSGR